MRKNHIENLGITIEYIKRADEVHGKAISGLKGKIVRKYPIKHPKRHILDLPVELSDKRIDLHGKKFKIRGCKFFLSKSGSVQCIEIYDMHNTKLEKLVHLFTRDINRHAKRGLEVCSIYVNNQFNSCVIFNVIKPEILNTYAANEYFSISERRNRTVKERIHSIISHLIIIIITLNIFQEDFKFTC